MLNEVLIHYRNISFMLGKSFEEDWQIIKFGPYHVRDFKQVPQALQNEETAEVKDRSTRCAQRLWKR